MLFVPLLIKSPKKRGLTGELVNHLENDQDVTTSVQQVAAICSNVPDQ